MTQELLMMEIQAMEVLLLKKKKRLVELRKKYSKRSLSQMFPSISGIEKGSIDYRQDIP
jgi:hypothetical protein